MRRINFEELMVGQLMKKFLIRGFTIIFTTGSLPFSSPKYAFLMSPYVPNDH